MDDAPVTICHWCCSFCMNSCDRDGWWRWVPSPCRQTGQNSLEDIKKRDLEKELAEKESKNVEEKRREESVVALSLSLSLVPSLDAVLCARALCFVQQCKPPLQYGGVHPRSHGIDGVLFHCCATLPHACACTVPLAWRQWCVWRLSVCVVLLQSLHLTCAAWSFPAWLCRSQGWASG